MKRLLCTILVCFLIPLGVSAKPMDNSMDWKDDQDIRKNQIQRNQENYPFGMTFYKYVQTNYHPKMEQVEFEDKKGQIIVIK
ncbi:MAG: hypothetical protein Q4Q07_08390 [Tissierellia bacterium]|nr:hypothetical protein [Tissierellia bacterium]